MNFKLDKMEEKAIHQITSGAFASIAGSFVIDSLQMMIPWLITMACVIACDLVTGVRKSKLMGDHVRFSRACRATMGKMVTYFSFVVMVVMVNKAAGGSMHIDTYACLFVCFIEGCSIISNILKPKGYNFNLAAAIGLFCKKVFSVDKEDVTNIINKEETK
ncbi:phage holin family protein [Bacteroides timonensis]|uniref:phage holin family protein n=1 Tax=Bacteroides timonensis TaxID=1470345 RepID=UPI001FCB3BF6|nr:phage holin family protein [Bacteroides timonensis]